jgi:hypothetical protein
MSRVTEDRPLPQATALRVVRELDEGAWAEFVDHHPHGSIFHTPEMYRVLNERAIIALRCGPRSPATRSAR